MTSVISRRQLLKASTLAGAGLALTGCERIVSRVTQEMGQSLPSRITIANGARIDAAFHLLSRAGFGPWPGDLDRVRSMGPEAWLDAQLHPDSIDDTACD